MCSRLPRVGGSSGREGWRNSVPRSRASMKARAGQTACSDSTRAPPRTCCPAGHAGGGSIGTLSGCAERLTLLRSGYICSICSKRLRRGRQQPGRCRQRTQQLFGITVLTSPAETTSPAAPSSREKRRIRPALQGGRCSSRNRLPSRCNCSGTSECGCGRRRPAIRRHATDPEMIEGLSGGLFQAEYLQALRMSLGHERSLAGKALDARQRTTQRDVAASPHHRLPRTAKGPARQLPPETPRCRVRAHRAIHVPRARVQTRRPTGSAAADDGCHRAGRRRPDKPAANCGARTPARAISSSRLICPAGTVRSSQLQCCTATPARHPRRPDRPNAAPGSPVRSPAQQSRPAADAGLHRPPDSPPGPATRQAERQQQTVDAAASPAPASPENCARTAAARCPSSGTMTATAAAVTQ